MLTDFPEEERHLARGRARLRGDLGLADAAPTACATTRELPAKAREYLERLAELVGVASRWSRPGAVRDETILVNDSVLTRWFPALRSALPAH